jgi:3-mercaptopyruvate sulfurtransferase SseA
VPSFDTLLREIRGKTIEIEVATLDREMLNGKPSLIDVREPDEHAQGMIPGTVHIPRGFLELRIERAVPDRAAPVVVYCASGTRSVLAARSSPVGSPAGSARAWRGRSRSRCAPIRKRATRAIR